MNVITHSTTLGFALDCGHLIQYVHHGAVKAWQLAFISFIAATGTTLAAPFQSDRGLVAKSQEAHSGRSKES